jgi:hypothetical protein
MPEGIHLIFSREKKRKKPQQPEPVKRNTLFRPDSWLKKGQKR